jgi:hypothetical protein
VSYQWHNSPGCYQAWSEAFGHSIDKNHTHRERGNPKKS